MAFLLRQSARGIVKKYSRQSPIPVKKLIQVYRARFYKTLKQNGGTYSPHFHTKIPDHVATSQLTQIESQTCFPKMQYTRADNLRTAPVIKVKKSKLK